MNSINEKEKKLNLALDELKNLDLTNPDLKNNIQNLNLQKNQLEIESAAKLINQKIKKQLKEEAITLNFMKDEEHI